MAEVDISGDVVLAAGNCTVGFVDSEASPPGSLGSGTLISFGPVVGILTCAHVVDAVSKKKRFGLVSFSRGPGKPQGLTVDTDRCEWISIKGAHWSEAGPDIGFVVLPAGAAELIGAIATITNGENRRREVFEKQPECDLSTCCVLGGVSEWTAGPVDAGTYSITQFHSLANVGKIRRFDGSPEFDYYEFEAEPEQSFELPKSYQGVSGGGLWKFYFKDDDEGLNLVDSRLIGVAFYETDRGTILCHGPKSIYAMLYSKLPIAPL